MAPGQRATVVVVLASLVPTPVRTMAGSTTKVPPPATALSAPPTAAARKSKMPCAIVISCLNVCRDSTGQDNRACPANNLPGLLEKVAGGVTNLQVGFVDCAVLQKRTGVIRRKHLQFFQNVRGCVYK